MSLVYSRAALVTIFESIPRTHVRLSVWRILNHFGISSVKATRRGCKAGRRKTAADILTGSLFPSKNGLVSESSGPVRREFVHRNVGNLHIASFSLLSPQVVTSATAFDLGGTDLTAGFQGGHKVPQIIDPRLRTIANLVCIKPNIQLPTIKKNHLILEMGMRDC